MKTKIFFIIVLAISLAGCKTQQKASLSANDDVYLSKNQQSKQITQNPSQTENLSVPRDVISDSSSSTKPGSSTFSEDYNDYSYAARINRFNHPVKESGYYDEIYSQTDKYDTVISSSSSPDVNIYMGGGYDPFWGSSVSFGFGFGWGYPYYGWGYPYYGYYYPYYDWYYPWGYPYYYYPGSYYCGYYDGYYNGYWDGYYGYPYDPYPYKSYYGRRDMTTAGGYNSNEINRSPQEQNNQDMTLRNDRTQSNVRNEREASQPPAYERSTNTSNSYAANSGRESRSTVNNTNALPSERSGANNASLQKEQYRYTRSSNQQTVTYQRNTNQSNQTARPAPRYSRPQSSTVQPRAGNSQNYSSPAYRQPKSSQEYINPRPQSSRSYTNPQENSSRNSYSSPSGREQRYSSPSNNVNNSRKYSAPSNSQNRSYSTPSKSYSSPSRSSSPSYSSPSRSTSPSYSAPSRSSSPSYSAPSRSGGSSGGSSGGGGGGSRRR